MIQTTVAVLVSHWRRHPGQLTALLVGLALATALWSAVQAINSEARAQYAKAASQLTDASLPRLQREDGREMSVADFVALRRSGWQVSPVIEEYMTLGSVRVSLTGIDFVSHPPLSALASADPDISAMEFLIPPGHALAHPDLAKALANIEDLPPITPSKDIPPGMLLTDIGHAELLLGRPGTVSHMIILPDQTPGLPAPAQVVPGIERVAVDHSGDIARLTGSFHLNLTAFGLLSFCVGLLIVHGAVGLAFEQRRGTIRVLLALGLDVQTLATLLLAELLCLALLAGTVGLAIGFFVAQALLPEVALTLRGLYGASVEDGLSLRPGWIFPGLAMAAGGTLLASAQALWRIWKLPRIATPGVRVWLLRNRRTDRTRVIAGLGLIGLGGLAPTLHHGLLAGFAQLTGVLAGSALLLPSILAFVLKLGALRARTAFGEWLWSDTRAQLPGLSLALAALLLALATNIGVGTMVSSFRLAFLGWLDQRLASELYIRAETDAQGREIAQWLGRQGATALAIRQVDLDGLGGVGGRLYGIENHATYRDHWPLIAGEPDVWDRLARGDAALVNEQLARRQGLWPGAELTLAEGWHLPVAGVYSDYGNPRGQAMVAIGLLDARFPDLPKRSFAVRVDTDRVGELASDLQAQFELPRTAVTDQATAKRRSVAVFDTTFRITDALGILTLGVAAIAILTALLTLQGMRLPQLAPVWALGVTRARLAYTEILRNVGLAALTSILALPLGLTLAWVLLAVVNVEAFGWRLPMRLFPLDWLKLMALAVTAAAVAALPPALRLRQAKAADLLREFVHVC